MGAGGPPESAKWCARLVLGESIFGDGEKHAERVNWAVMEIASSLPLNAWPTQPMRARDAWISAHLDAIGRSAPADCIWWASAAAAYGLTVIVVYDVADFAPIVFGRGPNVIWVGWIHGNHFVALDVTGIPLVRSSGTRDLFPAEYLPPARLAGIVASSCIPPASAASPTATITGPQQRAAANRSPAGACIAKSVRENSAKPPPPLAPGSALFSRRPAGMDTDGPGGRNVSRSQKRWRQNRGRQQARDTSAPGQARQQPSSSADARNPQGINADKWPSCKLCGAQVPQRALVRGYCVVQCAK